MKRLAILAVLFVGLGAFVYFYEIAGREARDKARDLEESVFRLERDEIGGVEIRLRDQAPVLLRKEGETWLLRQPLETLADRAAVDSFLSDVTGSRRERMFSVEGLDLEPYGLVDPEMTLRVRTADLERTLLIGFEDFSGTQRYVRFEGEEEIILTSNRLYSAADKDVSDWRSRKVIDFDRARTESVQLRRDGDEIELAQRDDRWYLQAPLEERADQGAVGSLLSSLDLARAREFVDEDPRSLLDYGLDRPAIVVRLRERGSDLWRHLEIGKKEGETYFARDPQRTAVFTVTEDLVDDLTLDLWAFRDKEVVEVRQDEVDRLSIEQDGEEIVLRHENFRWIVESPEDLLDREVFAYRFWYPIDDLEFAEILEEGEIESPEVEMRIGLKDGTERRYRFGRSGGRCLAERVESGHIGVLADEDCDKLRFDIREIVDTD